MSYTLIARAPILVTTADEEGCFTNSLWRCGEHVLLVVISAQNSHVVDLFCPNTEGCGK